MNKDFHSWIKIKSKTHRYNTNRFYRTGEIWWCAFGMNIGSEMDGKGHDFLRPIIIIKGFSREMCIGLPLTTKKKKDIFHHKINLEENTPGYVVLSQIRVIDTKRLVKRMGEINPIELMETKKAFIRIIA